MSAPESAPYSPLDTKELAAVMALRVELADVRILETQARCVPAVEEQLPDRLRFQLEHEHALDREKKSMVIKLRLGVDALPAGESLDPLLHIQATFLLAYVLKSADDITDAHCDAFADLNATFNVWPYWREYVQSVTVRMGLPALVLPLYRFGQRLTEGNGTADPVTAPALAHASPEERQHADIQR